MGWQVRNPRFEVGEYGDEGWAWVLFNDGAAVAESYVEHRSKEDVLDFIRWLKYFAQDVPIAGPGIVEL